MWNLLRLWWTEPVQTRWLLDFFESRSLTTPVRLLIGACAGAFAIIPTVMLFSQSGPHGFVGRTVSVFFAAGAVAWMARWWFGSWPGPKLSAFFLLYSDIGITLVCLQDTNRLVGLSGSTLFVVTGAYATFFHGPKTLILHLGWSLMSVVALAIPVAVGPDPDVALAFAKTLVALVAIVGVPPVLQFGFWLIRSNAVDSQVDPLTGLLNRRGLQIRSGRIVTSEAAREGQKVVAVIAIDLDRFKAVNDTFGHSVGDEVLIRTARRIRSVVRGTSVVARLGGEEFVVIDIVPLSTPAGLAERIRRAIAAPADRAPITASLGVVALPNAHFRTGEADAVSLMDDMLVRADLAMYEGKRTGGNSVSVDPALADLVDGESDKHPRSA